MDKIFEVRKLLAEKQVDAILLYKPANVSWISDFTGDSSMVIVAEKAEYFITDSRYTEQAEKEIPASFEIKEIRAEVRYKVLNDIMTQNNVKKLGIEGQYITLADMKDFEQAFSAEYVMVDNEITALRAVKTEAELKIMRKAANITQDCFDHLLGYIKAGVSETDILAHRQFDDAICYGGWCIDLHAPHGLLDYDRLPSDCNYYQGVYGIPYRSYYSKNIKNLYMAGRNISTTRLGLASTRIIGCCAIGGEAVGIAAAMCAKYGCTPRELSPKYIHELQQRILKADGYLPNVRNCDPKDLAREAEFDATSYLPGGEPAQVKNGISRKLLNEWNAWISAPLGKDGEILTMRWSQPRTLSQLRLTFWSDFNYPIRITMAPNRQKQQRVGVPAELIKDYTVRLKRDGKTLREIAVRENHQRLNVLNFESTECDLVEIAVHATNGHEKAVIFEVRAYGE